jgi:hypothetical protein
MTSTTDIAVVVGVPVPEQAINHFPLSMDVDTEMAPSPTVMVKYANTALIPINQELTSSMKSHPMVYPAQSDTPSLSPVDMTLSTMPTTSTELPLLVFTDPYALISMLFFGMNFCLSFIPYNPL